MAFLAYANGANDNFKGVATLFGCNTVPYRKALAWATVTTFAGSLAAVFLAGTLIKNFSGKGLVPDSIAVSPEFAPAVAVGAGATVLLATVLGFPISTTHGLTGALVGAGLATGMHNVNFAALGKTFFLPLAASPLVAVLFSAGTYSIFHRVRLALGIERESCVCVARPELSVVAVAGRRNLSSPGPTLPAGVVVSHRCYDHYRGHIARIDAETGLNASHFVSTGIVSFARGLNDTPKIAALLLAAQVPGVAPSFAIAAAAMAVGGLLHAKKVALTMSKKITPLNHGQGFAANLVTGLLVIFASKLGMPVSTTHVSVGSLFGIGLITREGNKRVISQIILSWALTLPVSLLLSMLAYRLLAG